MSINSMSKDLAVYSTAAAARSNKHHNDEEEEEEQDQKRLFEPVKQPGAAMRRVVAENCSLAGGTAAVLLQIAMRGVGLGVAERSGFTRDPVGRARRSLVYIYVMAFGTEEERGVVADATERAHRGVVRKRSSSSAGEEMGGGGGGGEYDANDPELQLWVAATMYWSLVASYEQVYGALPPAVADEAYDEFSVYATALRVPAGMWPSSRAAFAAYWEEKVAPSSSSPAALEITPQARRVARDVLYPEWAGARGEKDGRKGKKKQKRLPWWLWVFTLVSGPGNRAVTSEMLPRWIGEALEVPRTRLGGWYVYWVVGGWNRWVYRWCLPRRARHAAKDYYMGAFRRRLAEGERGL